MGNETSARYGKSYWCVKVPKWVSQDGEIYFNADSVRVVDGCMMSERKDHQSECAYRKYIYELFRPYVPGQTEAEKADCNCDGPIVSAFTLAPRQWIAWFSASCMDGHAICVDHWAGEIAGDGEKRSPGRPPGSKNERGKMTPQKRYSIFRRDGFRCIKCGAQSKDGKDLHVDHIRPISKGGKTTFTNLQTLCSDCNHGKGASVDPPPIAP